MRRSIINQKNKVITGKWWTTTGQNSLAIVSTYTWVIRFSLTAVSVCAIPANTHPNHEAAFIIATETNALWHPLFYLSSSHVNTSTSTYYNIELIRKFDTFPPTFYCPIFLSSSPSNCLSFIHFSDPDIYSHNASAKFIS